jgi:hypothetical protein
MSKRSQIHRSFIVVAFAFLLGRCAQAQGNGPRTMLMAPTGLNVITPAYLALGTNFNFQQDILIKGADISTNAVPVTYIRFFDIKGHFAQVWVTPIWGTISGKVKAGESTIELPDLNGFADPYFAMRVGLIGTPALGLEDFKKHAQTFQLSALIGANMPLGDYDQERPVNLGTNRWAIRIGAPMVLPFGKNPAQLYFLEMTPSLMLSTKNTAAFGGSERTQDPMFVLENHLTNNFTKKFWASAVLRL